MGLETHRTADPEVGATDFVTYSRIGSNPSAAPQMLDPAPHSAVCCEGFRTAFGLDSPGAQGEPP